MKKSLVVAGVMSGTSADGVDVAICRISRVGRGAPRIVLLGHLGMAYPKAVREIVLRAMETESKQTNLTVGDLSRLNWRLGEVYAQAVERAVKRFAVEPDLIACHGQTIYHQAVAASFAGRQVRATWQTGEASVIAERLRVPVVSDFRAADLAAGGQGAPLVPMLDHAMFCHATRNRVLLNLGGIANVTLIPAAASVDRVLAFDTGPANMVIDACMSELFGQSLDRNGAVAGRGRVLTPVVQRFMRDRFFAAAPPKSCGREQFGKAFATRFIAASKRAGGSREDIVATATALSAASIEDAYRRFVMPHLAQGAEVEMLVAGGGVRNKTLMEMIAQRLQPFDVKVTTTDHLGAPAQAKEAMAFALLGWLTWNRLAGNVPSATGARRPVVLGKVTLP